MHCIYKPLSGGVVMDSRRSEYRQKRKGEPSLDETIVCNDVLTFLVVVFNKIANAFREIIHRCTAIDTFRI